MVRLASVAAVLLLAGPAAAAIHLTVRIHGGATQIISSSCFLKLKQRITGGGTLVYCLKTFHGEPGPNAVVRDSGQMTFTFPTRPLTAGYTVVASVHVVQRFAADGAHARMSLTGRITGGHLDKKVVKGGTITGGGTDVEQPPGRVRTSSLRYVLVLR